MAEVRGLKGGERKKEASRGEEHDSVHDHPCYLTLIKSSLQNSLYGEIRLNPIVYNGIKRQNIGEYIYCLSKMFKNGLGHNSGAKM